MFMPCVAVGAWYRSTGADRLSLDPTVTTEVDSALLSFQPVCLFPVRPAASAVWASRRHMSGNRGMFPGDIGQGNPSPGFSPAPLADSIGEPYAAECSVLPVLHSQAGGPAARCTCRVANSTDSLRRDSGTSNARSGLGRPSDCVSCWAAAASLGSSVILPGSRVSESLLCFASPCF
ncbi:hypothetical protein CCHR01_08100 [Colletotrichum chrysophilum]|uniref:Uncharacterized protein n=1 Tax=Colletotrichum chrysophilum TaxID=1836956 RepID=A0AAD9AJL1_9PEZI|nr:hypothetical protein CCHR01_08100 [Colletotrichum chrysophilum]